LGPSVLQRRVFDTVGRFLLEPMMGYKMLPGAPNDKMTCPENKTVIIILEDFSFAG
jgi:hypothetical protein